MPIFGKVTFLIAFNKAKLQLSRLRIHQQECYGQRKAFTTAAITRWRTQLAAVKSVFDNKDALRAFARDSVILNGMKQVIVKEEEQVTQPSLPQVISYINDLEFGPIWKCYSKFFSRLAMPKPTQNATARDLGRSFHVGYPFRLHGRHWKRPVKTH
jgi:hypothetical protein